MKIEYCVMRDGKIWFNCANEAEAINLAQYRNVNCRDQDTSEYVACIRRVSEWKKI